MLLHCLYTSCMCNTTLCLTYFLFGYEISLFGGLWCLHFHFVPFLSLLYSVLYALIIRTKSRRAYTSLHTKLFIKHFPGIDCRIFQSIIYIIISRYFTISMNFQAMIRIIQSPQNIQESKLRILNKRVKNISKPTLIVQDKLLITLVLGT